MRAAAAALAALAAAAATTSLLHPPSLSPLREMSASYLPARRPYSWFSRRELSTPWQRAWLRTPMAAVAAEEEEEEERGEAEEIVE